MTNQELLERIAGKAMTTTSTLGAAALLQPEKADRYTRKLQNKAVVLPEARLLTMKAVERHIDRIFFPGQILHAPPAEGQTYDPNNFEGVTADQQVLRAVKAMTVVPLTDEVIEENIEREAYRNTLLDLIAERVGLDVEEWGINGDTGSANELFALNDGWLKLAGRRTTEDDKGQVEDDFTTGGSETTQTLDLSGNVPQVRYPVTGYFRVATVAQPGAGGDLLVARDNGDGTIVQLNASGITGTIDYNSGDVTLAGLIVSTQYFHNFTPKQFDKDDAAFPANMFDLMIEAVPDEYFTNESQWRLYVPRWVEKAYRDYLKARGTDLGDRAVTGIGGIPYEGIPVVKVPSMPLTRSWLTHPNNTIYGVFRQITLEAEREAKAQRTDFVNSLRVDFQYEDPEATVVAEIEDLT